MSKLTEILVATGQLRLEDAERIANSIAFAPFLVTAQDQELRLVDWTVVRTLNAAQGWRDGMLQRSEVKAVDIWEITVAPTW